jgi:ABC-type polysaccharide/polyol phosphate transport system ATPase subunit
MSETVIKVEGLSKQYKITHEKQDTNKTLSQTITENTKKLLMPWKFFQTQDLEIFKAIDNVNFEIKKGDKVAIIGRNGAGKSTLLKVLSRITEPTEGTVKIKGRVASLLEVGTGFHPELTGRENIFLNGAVLGMSKKEIREKFDDIVDFSGCEKFLDTPVKRYSSGMRVRLGFAVAAHLESEILIVDEVLAVGDAEFQKKCLGKMDEISKGEGRTIIFVSHNISAVKNLCNKGIVLEKGGVVELGNIDECLSFYNKYSSIENDIIKCHNSIKYERFFLEKKESNIDVRIMLYSMESFNDVTFDFVILNNNSYIYHYHTAKQGVYKNLIAGKNELHINLSIPLADGRYQMAFELESLTQGVLFRIENVSIDIENYNLDYISNKSLINVDCVNEIKEANNNYEEIS